MLFSSVSFARSLDRIYIKPFQVDKVQKVLVEVVKGTYVRVLRAQINPFGTRKQLGRADHGGISIEIRIRVSDYYLHI